MPSVHFPPPHHARATHTYARTRRTQPEVTGPSSAVSHTRLNLGDAQRRKQLQAFFTLTNQGSQPFQFNVSGSCGCAYLRLLAGTLAVRQSVRICLAIRLPQATDPESTQALISSQVARQPQVVCAATARAPAPWEISPTHVNFGYVVREQLGHPLRQQVVARHGNCQPALTTSGIHTPAQWLRIVYRPVVPPTDACGLRQLCRRGFVRLIRIQRQLPVPFKPVPIAHAKGGTCHVVQGA